MPGDEAHGTLDLVAGILCTPQRRVALWRFGHGGVAIGAALPMEVEAPNVESRGTQFVAPGTTIKPMRYGERGRKGGTVDVENDLRDTRPFANVTELVGQLRRDVDAARAAAGPAV